VARDLAAHPVGEGIVALKTEPAGQVAFEGNDVFALSHRQAVECMDDIRVV
jgi:hypothetical protein